MLDLTQRFRRNPDIIIKNIGGMQVALNIEDGSEYKLNEISYDMLEALSTPLTICELVEILLQQYNVEKERLMMDSETWFTKALEKELIIV
jgi:hypothetical protein